MALMNLVVVVFLLCTVFCADVPSLGKLTQAVLPLQYAEYSHDVKGLGGAVALLAHHLSNYAFDNEGLKRALRDLQGEDFQSDKLPHYSRANPMINDLVLSKLAAEDLQSPKSIAEILKELGEMGGGCLAVLTAEVNLPNILGREMELLISVLKIIFATEPRWHRPFSVFIRTLGVEYPPPARFALAKRMGLVAAANTAPDGSWQPVATSNPIEAELQAIVKEFYQDPPQPADLSYSQIALFCMPGIYDTLMALGHDLPHRISRLRCRVSGVQVNTALALFYSERPPSMHVNGALGDGLVIPGAFAGLAPLLQEDDLPRGCLDVLSSVPRSIRPLLTSQVVVASFEESQLLIKQTYLPDIDCSQVDIAPISLNIHLGYPLRAVVLKVSSARALSVGDFVAVVPVLREITSLMTLAGLSGEGSMAYHRFLIEATGSSAMILQAVPKGSLAPLC